MASHGRYTILGKLADGGMAEIFLAIQHGAEGFEKPVVLKRILTQFSADQQFRNMLLDEAHISMTLQHSNIAQVLDLGVAAGRYFLALELVDGWDLERILQRAHAAGMVWPAALGLYVTACVCRALAYAHAKSRDGRPLGIVHRDISPNNVLISDQGEVKLTDFGIAKAQRKREQTAAGVIKGKVAYMSPEQAIGGLIDKRSDIFSVGSMLYRMMTDQLPFAAGSDMDALLRVQKGEFAPPEKAKSTVGPAVSTIIMRAMRLAPSERYQGADDMLADVERALRNEFHSAGQTELKLWVEQLGRRDAAAPIGKQRLDTSGVVKDMLGTDLSAGVSFQLDDLDQATDQTEIALAKAAASAAAAADVKPSGAATDRVPPARPRPIARRSGFWFGVVFALAAVVGGRSLFEWAERRGVMRALGFGGPEKTPPPPATGQPPPSPPATASAVSPTAARSTSPAPAAGTDDASGAARDVGEGAQAGAMGKTAPVAEKVVPVGDKSTVATDKSTVAADKSAEADEPDEEALLRDAVPNAESAVIGGEEGEVVAPRATGGKAGGKSRAAGAKGSPVVKADTAILHLASAPGGAIVKTRARVLGRTPINLHFKTGVTYEIVFIKRGYQNATRRVAVRGAKDRKIAVTLKKRPVAKKASFFHPHR